MKKLFLSVITIISFICPLFSQNLDDLYGIWEGKDRFVFIEPSIEKSEKGSIVGEEEKERIELVILLKDFYGWYYDRVAEPSKYSDEYPRSRNSATTRNAEHVYLDVQQIDKSELDNTYDLVLTYSKRQITHVPIVILDNNMFLNFAVQDKDDENFYRGNAVSKGITASEQSINEDLTSYYIKDNLIYDIRYWITDMDYEDNTVSYKKDDIEFTVDKHISSSGNIYACVPGRRRVIRNPFDPNPFNLDEYYLTDDRSILLLDNTPYLTKLADKDTFEQLMEIVEKANSRVRPDPDPLFPDMYLDFHWDVIDMLEANNELIQQVRERQKAFGPRGKDFDK